MAATTRDPLLRLYRTKFTLLAVVSIFIGVVLWFVGHNSPSWTGWSWLNLLPFTEAGSSLFIFGLVGVAWEFLDRRDAEERAIEHLRAALPEQATLLRSAVIDGFAASPDSLAHVASPAILDRVAQNCLAIRLGNQRLAAGAYADLCEQVSRAKGSCSDMQISVALTPWTDGPALGKGAKFVATVRWEYRTVPTSPIMRLACTSDLDAYRELLVDPSMASVWFLEPTAPIDAASPEAFQLVQFSVDGRSLAARRTSRAGTQVISVNLGAQQRAEPYEVTVAYAYRVLVQRHSHMLALDIAKPTENLSIDFAYGGCGIRHVNVLDYIASARQPRVSRLPASGPSPTIKVGFDGWVLPKAGVAFVWVLDAELAGRLE